MKDRMRAYYTHLLLEELVVGAVGGHSRAENTMCRRSKKDLLEFQHYFLHCCHHFQALYLFGLEPVLTHFERDALLM